MDAITLTSADGTATVYACGNCSTLKGRGDQADAEACCRCTVCGANLAPDGKPNYKLNCPDCEHAAAQARAAERDAKELAAPIVEYDGGPVYTDHASGMSGNYFAELDEAIDAIWDQSDGPIDWSTVVINTCTVSKASTLNIQERIEEQWSESFEDGDYSDPLTPEVIAEIQALQAKLDALAPTVWNAKHERVLGYPLPHHLDVTES